MIAAMFACSLYVGMMTSFSNWNDVAYGEKMTVESLKKTG
jgi:hypothetical protein